MRKKLLIGLAVYLAVGVVIALVKMPGTYLCPDYHGPSGFTTIDESCHPITSASDRLRFIGKVAPTWPYLAAQEGIGPRPVMDMSDQPDRIDVAGPDGGPCLDAHGKQITVPATHDRPPQPSEVQPDSSPRRIEKDRMGRTTEIIEDDDYGCEDLGGH